MIDKSEEGINVIEYFFHIFSKSNDVFVYNLFCNPVPGIFLSSFFHGNNIIQGNVIRKTTDKHDLQLRTCL